jgi:hypothetical protein
MCTLYNFLSARITLASANETGSKTVALKTALCNESFEAKRKFASPSPFFSSQKKMVLRRYKSNTKQGKKIHCKKKAVASRLFAQ